MTVEVIYHNGERDGWHSVTRVELRHDRILTLYIPTLFKNPQRGRSKPEVAELGCTVHLPLENLRFWRVVGPQHRDEGRQALQVRRQHPSTSQKT